MNYIKCPKCQAEIEGDSCFCDQCGAELYVCPKCGTLGKGKRCTRCGEPLVAVRTLGSTARSADNGRGSGVGSPTSAASPASQSSAPAASSPTFGSSSITADINKLLSGMDFDSVKPSPKTGPSTQPLANAGATIRPGATPSPTSQATPRQVPGHLVCRNPQLRLYIDEVLIGRREGGYASVFASFGMVSGRHAQISRTPSGGWQVTDLGSTNGTRLNGHPLPPNSPTPFWVGDTITFADIDFEALP